MSDTGIIYYPRGERVTAHIAPAAKAPWNILSAYKARRHAEQAEETGLWSLAATLRAYADKVDELQGRG